MSAALAVPAAPTVQSDLSPVYAWLSKVAKAERGYTGSAAHHLMNYYEGASDEAAPSVPQAPSLTDADIESIIESMGWSLDPVEDSDVKQFARAIERHLSAAAARKEG